MFKLSIIKPVFPMLPVLSNLVTHSTIDIIMYTRLKPDEIRTRLLKLYHHVIYTLFIYIRIPQTHVLLLLTQLVWVWYRVSPRHES